MMSCRGLKPWAAKLYVKPAPGTTRVIVDGMVVKVVRVNRGDLATHRRSLPEMLGGGRRQESEPA